MRKFTHLIGFLLLLAAWLPAAPALAQAQGVGFGLRPQDPAKGYFVFEVQPGQVINDAVVVTNQSDQPRSFRLMAVGGHTAATGGASLSFEQIDGPASWIELNSTQVQDHLVSLPAGSSAQVPFTLSVPTGVRPGEYAAGFLVSPVEENAEQPAGEAVTTTGSSFHVKVVSQVGVMVIITVPGQQDSGCQIAVEKIDRNILAGRWNLGLRLHNSGDVHFGGLGHLTLRPAAGGEPVLSRDFNVGYFIAGDAISYPLQVELPPPGQYTAEVTLTDHRFPACAASYRETVEITRSEQAQAVQQAKERAGQTDQKAWYEYPMLQAGVLILGVALMALAGLLFYILVIRKRKEVG